MEWSGIVYKAPGTTEHPRRMKNSLSQSLWSLPVQMQAQGFGKRTLNPQLFCGISGPVLDPGGSLRSKNFVSLDQPFHWTPASQHSMV